MFTTRFVLQATATGNPTLHFDEWPQLLAPSARQCHERCSRQAGKSAGLPATDPPWLCDPIRQTPVPVSGNPLHLGPDAPVLRAEVSTFLAKEAIKPIPPAKMSTGFDSPYFIVPKKGGGCALFWICTPWTSTFTGYCSECSPRSAS